MRMATVISLKARHALSIEYSGQSYKAHYDRKLQR